MSKIGYKEALAETSSLLLAEGCAAQDDAQAMPHGTSARSVEARTNIAREGLRSMIGQGIAVAVFIEFFLDLDHDAFPRKTQGKVVRQIIHLRCFCIVIVAMVVIFASFLPRPRACLRSFATCLLALSRERRCSR